MSLIEVMIAIIITMIGVLTVLSLQPQGYMLSARSDQLGRAAAILREELETQEVRIMNQCNPVTLGTTTKTVYSSGQPSAQQGDVSYSVQTTISTMPLGANVWRVNVRVAGTKANITESLIVTRQRDYRQGC